MECGDSSPLFQSGAEAPQSKEGDRRGKRGRKGFGAEVPKQ